MKKELKTVSYIKKFGLNDLIETFNIKCKIYDKKIILKYDQIKSDMSSDIVQECRGLILERDTWRVMSLAFTKFFNSAEFNAAKIDWDTALIWEKMDGSLLYLYWDWNMNKWIGGTSGMAEGEGEVNDKPNTTFSKLFWETIDRYESFHKNNLVKGYTYAFELMTPYNIVVNPHKKSKVALLGVRNLETLEEFNIIELEKVSRKLGINLPKIYNINALSANDLTCTFEDVPYTDEGYVVCDANFNRVKIKNPAYLAMHHTKSKLGKYHILGVIKTNEIDEWLSTFPDRKEEIIKLKENLLILVNDLENIWGDLKKFKPINNSPEEQKKFAMKLFEVLDKNNKFKEFQGMFFSLKNGKSESVKDYIFNYDNKRLYERLIK